MTKKRSDGKGKLNPVLNIRRTKNEKTYSYIAINVSIKMIYFQI